MLAIEKQTLLFWAHTFEKYGLLIASAIVILIFLIIRAVEYFSNDTIENHRNRTIVYVK